MKLILFAFVLVFGFAQGQSNCGKLNNGNLAIANEKMPSKTPEKVKFDKLPDGVKLTDEVREELKDEKGDSSFKIISVEEKLKKIGAKYRNDILVDAAGKEIRFYKTPVRGASQGFEEDQKQQKIDAQELKELKEKCTVIILYVNPFKVA